MTTYYRTRQYMLTDLTDSDTLHAVLVQDSIDAITPPPPHKPDAPCYGLFYVADVVTASGQFVAHHIHHYIPA